MRGEGVKKCLFLSTLRVLKTVHAGGGEVKKWQNFVHVVVECTLVWFSSVKTEEMQTQPIILEYAPALQAIFLRQKYGEHSVEKVRISWLSIFTDLLCLLLDTWLIF